MQTEKISLTRALAEVKVLESRIKTAINNAKFVGVTQGKGRQPVDRTFKSSEELVAKIKADSQSIDALIARRSAIKSAITKANVTTMVKIGDRALSIAEAVELKQSLPLQQTLLTAMKNATARGAQEVVQLATTLDQKIATLVQHSFQNVSKPTEEQFTSVSKPQLDQFQPDLLDPLDVKEKIQKLEALLEDVKLNLDYSLSEVNARTEVEISY